MLFQINCAGGGDLTSDEQDAVARVALAEARRQAGNYVHSVSILTVKETLSIPAENNPLGLDTLGPTQT